jgi:hypothetical protein
MSQNPEGKHGPHREPDFNVSVKGERKRIERTHSHEYMAATYKPAH